MQDQQKIDGRRAYTPNRQEQNKLIGPAEPPKSSASPADAQVVLYSSTPTASLPPKVFSPRRPNAAMYTRGLFSAGIPPS